MKSLKFIDTDRGFKTMIAALGCIGVNLCFGATSHAGGYGPGVRPHAIHRYAILPHQYSPARPTSHAPHFGFFPTHWRGWPGLWATAETAEPSREEPERVQPEPADLPTEALPQFLEQPGEIIPPTPGEVEVEGGPPAPPTQLTPEAPPTEEIPPEGVAPPTIAEPAAEPPAEQPQPEPTPTPQTPSEPQLPPGLRETLPPPVPPEAQPLPSPDEVEEMPEAEPEGRLGRADGPRLSSATAESGWRARRPNRLYRAADRRGDRTAPASFGQAAGSTPQRLARMGNARPLDETINRYVSKGTGRRSASRDGWAKNSVSAGRATGSQSNVLRQDARTTHASAGNPLRREDRASHDRESDPSESIRYNPLRNRP